MSAQATPPLPSPAAPIGRPPSLWRAPRAWWHARTPSTTARALQAFQPQATVIEDTAPALFWRGLLWALALLVAVLLVWATVSRIPILTSAPGKFEAGAHTQIVQSLYSGQVQKILVHAGMRVRQGEPLIELNPHVDRQSLQDHLRALALNDAERRRVADELTGQTQVPTGAHETQSAALLEATLARADLAEERARLTADQAAVTEAQAQWRSARGRAITASLRARLDERLMREASPLVPEGALSGAHYAQLMDQALRAQGKAHRARRRVKARRAALTAAQATTHKDQAKFTDTLLQNLEQTLGQTYSLRRKVVHAHRHYAANWLRAPLTGIVQSLKVATVGTVVQPGETLATIEPPTQTLTVTADVPSRDIGFIHVGDTTHIKVSSYPFEQYGMIPGRVTWISPTAATTSTVAAPPAGENPQATSTPAPAASAKSHGHSGTLNPPTLYYRLHVQPLKDTLWVQGHRRTMHPGMTVTVDIRTGRRRVIDFFLDPIVKYLHNGVEER